MNGKMITALFSCACVVALLLGGCVFHEYRGPLTRKDGSAVPPPAWTNEPAVYHE
jgi:hypothetical protein